MQVSKFFMVLVLGLAITMFIVSPAVALEHPWEEGETGETMPGDGVPDPFDDSPQPDDQVPLLSSVTGPSFFWFHIVWDYLTDQHELTTQEVDTGSVVDSEEGTQSRYNRMGSTLR